MLKVIQKHGPRFLIEIIVIIIGILLSVFITNKFEDAREARREQKFLGQLKQDLQDDLESLRSDSVIRTEQYQNVKQMTAFVGGLDQNISASAMAKGVPSLLHPVRHTPTDATFRVLESTGTLSLLKEEDLLRSITRLYANTYADLIIADQNVEVFRSRFLLPYALSKFDFLASSYNPEFDPKLSKKDIVELTNQMVYATFSYKTSVETYVKALEEVRALIAQIDKQLD